MSTDIEAAHRDYSKELTALLEKAPEGYFDRLAATSLGKGAVESFIYYVEFIANASTKLEDKAFNLVMDWHNGLTDEEREYSRVYTVAEWLARGEACGKTALATVSFMHGWLLDVFNRRDRSKRAKKVRDSFIDLLRKEGFFFNMGYEWSLHIYKIPKEQ